MGSTKVQRMTKYKLWGTSVSRDLEEEEEPKDMYVAYISTHIEVRRLSGEESYS